MVSVALKLSSQVVPVACLALCIEADIGQPALNVLKTLVIPSSYLLASNTQCTFSLRTGTLLRYSA